MKHFFLVCLAVLGWISISLAIFIFFYGIWFGISEDRAFYDRQKEYHALDEQRDSLQNILDSLYAIYYDAIEVDSNAICPAQAQIDSIENSSEYTDLFGIPEPPMGFSAAILVGIVLCIFGLIPLIIGIILVIIAHIKLKATRT